MPNIRVQTIPPPAYSRANPTFKITFLASYAPVRRQFERAVTLAKQAINNAFINGGTHRIAGEVIPADSQITRNITFTSQHTIDPEALMNLYEAMVVSGTVIELQGLIIIFKTILGNAVNGGRARGAWGCEQVPSRLAKHGLGQHPKLQRWLEQGIKGKQIKKLKS